ncbi:hypothetical protein QEN19_004144 [Hanseniaspora menglaensis]
MPTATERFKEAIQTSVPSKNSLGQIVVDYTKPIDKDAPSTIKSIPLEHEYCQASMTLALDSLKQTESLGNKYIFWHPFLSILIVVVSSLFLKRYPLIHLSKVSEESVLSYAGKNLFKNKDTLTNFVLFIAFSVTVFFKLLANINSHYFSNVSQLLESENGKSVFGIDIKDYALDKNIINDKLILKNNANIIVYRDVPIALAALDTPLGNIKDEDEDIIELKNIATIKALSCRRVYLKSGILEDLLNWSKKRCLDLNETVYSKKNTIKGQSVYENNLIEKLQFKTYSYEYDLEKLMISNGFKLVKLEKLDSKINRLVILLNAIGIRTKTWEIKVPVKESN